MEGITAWVAEAEDFIGGFQAAVRGLMDSLSCLRSANIASMLGRAADHLQLLLSATSITSN